MRTLLLFILLLVNLYSSAQTQFLDPTFGQSGTVVTDIDNNKEDPHDVYVQADGKIVVTGDLEVNSIEDFMVVRYNTDGTLDETFGNGGIVAIDFSPGNDDIARGLHFLTNGQMIILGRREDPENSFETITITRLNSDGSLDTTFGTNGYVEHEQPFDMNMSDLLSLGDGKFLSCGFNNDSGFADFILARFNSDGSLDESFGNSGYVVRNVLNSFDFIRETAELENGDVIGVGWSNDFMSNIDFPILTRYTSNGTPVIPFGEDGVIQVDLGGIDDTYRNIQLIGNTHFIALGKIELEGQDEDIIVSKYDLNGELDTAFGIDGHFIYDVTGSDDQGDGLAVQDDGKIVLGFTTENETNGKDVGLIRLLPNGSIDNSFAQNGVFTLNVENDDNVENITLQSDGLAIMVGKTNEGTPQQDLLLMRVTGTSITSELDELEPVNMIHAYPNPVVDWLQLEAVLPNDELYRCEVYAIDGRLLKRFNFLNDTRVQLNDLPTGQYILYVFIDGKSTRVKIGKT